MAVVGLSVTFGLIARDHGQMAPDRVETDGTAPRAPEHSHTTPEAAPHPHEGGEGLTLIAATQESVGEASGCTDDQPLRRYDIAALAVDITLNRYLDHDPDGRMYALVHDVAAVRAEEEANRRARESGSEPAVSVGQQGDLIAPLTLRALPGDCLVVSMRNDLVDEPASFHLHGSSLRVAPDGGAATAANTAAMADPGETVVYAWSIPGDEPEGTHHFHSHGEEREQTSHGLFGAVIVEPPGSTWVDPLTGEEAATGWQMVVTPPEGRPFREFTVYYHEIGNEDYQLLDANDALVPVVDPLTSAYRPGSRALNYRSEPFLNRLRLQQERTGTIDESLAYSSYSFGDPATPILRGYLGEPVKQRVVHGGSETFHVHHVHGGSVRWPRQPGDEQIFGEEFGKVPSLLPDRSERTDSQSLGPSETFDVVQECGAGGCQESAGDFMYHCHVGHHYFAGMWSIVRVYNTVQDGPHSTDALPPLAPLEDLDLRPAVTTDELVDQRISTPEGSRRVTSSTLSEVIEPQLPPAGTPGDYDASVYDWQREGDRYLTEPETTERWPAYRARAPGVRPALLVDPRTGRLAYPVLRPHLAARPPFAPGHGPAPFLDPFASGLDPPPPGASGSTSLCPSDTTSRPFAINAIRQPVDLDDDGRLRDSNGMLFVLRSQRDAVREEREHRVPLAIRVNARVDCVDVLLRSELRDDRTTPFSKVGTHTHFMQFDVQASDGVNLGFNYEQTVRPYELAGASLTATAPAGDVALSVDDGARFRPGALVGVGMDRDETFEVAEITAIEGSRLTLAGPLRFHHSAGEVVSTEFVRYRWFPDAQVGTSYFHDHTDVLTTLTHGLFGALVVEPPDATWTHPSSGDPLPSGVLADVRTSEPVGLDVDGSFREMVLFTQDGIPITHQGRSTGGAFGMRAEPLRRRDGPPELQFSSSAHGDPSTPMLRAFLGDPMVIRNTVAAGGEVHTLHVDGHTFRTEPWSETSPRVSTVNLGISERYDLVIPAAGGAQQMPGDYLYHSGRHVKWIEGSWGIIRVFGPGDRADLRRLPGREDAPEPAEEACPADAPVRRFSIAAVEVPLPMLGGDPGRVFVSTDVAADVVEGRRRVEPLVLRAAVGDCLEVELENRLEVPVSLHADRLAAEPSQSGGVAVGTEPDQSVAPGERRTSTFHASPEVGETVALLHDFADPMTNIRLGAFGAVVVAPTGSSFTDPANGSDLEGRSSWQAIVDPPDGDPYRDFALFFQDEDAGLGTHLMPYAVRVRGVVGVNYGVQDRDGHPSDADMGGAGAPPVVEAVAGDPVRLHVLAPWSEQAQVFSLEGHRWPQEPGFPGTPLLSSVRFGGHEALTLHIDSAGGADGAAGRYRYGNHRAPFTEAGAWGIFEVRDEPGDGIVALQSSSDSAWPVVLLLTVVALASVGIARGRRQARERRQAVVS